jgi:hypothetical protein
MVAKSNGRAVLAISAVLCGVVLLSWSLTPAAEPTYELLTSKPMTIKDLEKQAVHWSPAEVRLELAKVVQTVLHLIDHPAKAGPPGAPGAPGPKGSPGSKGDT